MALILSKVLLVDDEPDIRRIGQISLEHVGQWKVVQAQSGLQALTLAADDRPDVVLLDVIMPEVGGAGTVGRRR